MHLSRASLEVTTYLFSHLSASNCFPSSSCRFLRALSCRRAHCAQLRNRPHPCPEPFPLLFFPFPARATATALPVFVCFPFFSSSSGRVSVSECEGRVFQEFIWAASLHQCISRSCTYSCLRVYSVLISYPLSVLGSFYTVSAHGLLLLLSTESPSLHRSMSLSFPPHQLSHSPGGIFLPPKEAPRAIAGSRSCRVLVRFCLLACCFFFKFLPLPALPPLTFFYFLLR